LRAAVGCVVARQRRSGLATVPRTAIRLRPP
jgi:hypothetical protein